jgi:hypothetical protein
MALLLIFLSLFLGAFPFGTVSHATGGGSSRVLPARIAPPAREPCAGSYAKKSSPRTPRLPKGCAPQLSPSHTP